MTTLHGTVSEEKAQIFFLNKGFSFEIFFQLTYSVLKTTGILMPKEKMIQGKVVGQKHKEQNQAGWDGFRKRKAEKAWQAGEVSND